MTLTDGLIVLSVFGIFGYIMWMKFREKNSPLTQKTREWIQKAQKRKIEIQDVGKWQQTHSEKRQIM